MLVTCPIMMDAVLKFGSNMSEKTVKQEVSSPDLNRQEEYMGHYCLQEVLSASLTSCKNAAFTVCHDAEIT